MPVRSSVLLSVLIAAVAWPPQARGAGVVVLRISGTGSSLGTMRQLAAAYQAAHLDVVVKQLPSVGSSGAIKAVAEGAIELGLSGRPLRPEEEARGLVGMPYARTPFVFAVGPRVGVTDITPAELARIYRGDLHAWPDGGRIRLVMRPRADVDTLLIRSFSPALDAAMELALDREGLVMAPTNQDCDETLAHTPGSIGPSTLTQLLTESPTLRALTWNGVKPTLENLTNGTYPLAKPLHLVIRSRPSPAVQAFVEFLGTPEARRILERTGNLPVALPRLP